MGILLGLVTALCWGSADLLARFSARSIGTWRTMLYMQFTGLVLMTAAMRWLGGWGHLADGSGLRPWTWGILAGVLNAVSTLALYRSFEIGKMSIVAPISSAYPALTMALSAMTGERLTVQRVVGILTIITGVLVVAHGEESPADESIEEQAIRAKKRAGIGWAIVSGVGFGAMFWLLGIRVVPLLGSAPSVWLIRLTSLVLTAGAMLLARRPVALPGGAAKRWILGVGILDTSAYVLNNFGMQREQVSVVSVLASLYGAVTVGLAATVLGEKVSHWQWTGVAAIFVGIVLISW
jgi:drug/metabolite transporter (DMT)-like permease